MVGHHNKQGGGAAPTSWNAAHSSKGCSQQNLISTGGNGSSTASRTDAIPALYPALRPLAGAAGNIPFASDRLTRPMRALGARGGLPRQQRYLGHAADARRCNRAVVFAG